MESPERVVNVGLETLSRDTRSRESVPHFRKQDRPFPKPEFLLVRH